MSRNALDCHYAPELPDPVARYQNLLQQMHDLEWTHGADGGAAADLFDPLFYEAKALKLVHNIQDGYRFH
jgi:hypothetical protein